MSTDQRLTRQCDAVVVGGRCAGAATARLLAQRGLDVAVVDRAAFPSDTLSTHAIAGHGVELLHQWGLLDTVLATGVPNPRTVGYAVGAVDLPVVPLPDESLGTLAPRRTVLDQLLLDAAREAGVETWTSTSVTGLLRDGAAVRGVRCRRPDGSEADVVAPLVIGADGARSRVAAEVGATRYAVRSSRLGGVYAYFEGTGIEQNELGLRPDALSVAFPTNDGLTVIAVGTDDERFRDVVAGGDVAVAELAQRSSPRIAEGIARGVRRTRFHAYRPRENCFVVPHGPGWVLVGDAGVHLDPITGQGIANAFLAAELLADAVADGLGGAVPLAERLDQFHRERDALLEEIHATTSDASSLTWNEDEIVTTFLRFRAAVEATVAQVRSRGAGTWVVSPMSPVFPPVTVGS